MCISLTSVNRQLSDPQSDWDAKLNDVSLILDSVIEQVRNMACELGQDERKDVRVLGSSLFGTLYLAEIAGVLACDAHSEIREKGVSK